MLSVEQGRDCLPFPWLPDVDMGENCLRCEGGNSYLIDKSIFREGILFLLTDGRSGRMITLQYFIRNVIIMVKNTIYCQLNDREDLLDMLSPIDRVVA